MKKNFISFVFVLILIAGFTNAQQSDTQKQNIFESLAEPDSLTHATVVVHQDKRIDAMLASRTGSMGTRMQNTVAGYRVQVFSSNTQRTAKADAFRIEKMIQDEFPNETVYVNYTSPFWKVRVGDFRTQSEAQSFRSQLIEIFPNLKKETYVVREQIVISGTK